MLDLINMLIGAAGVLIAAAVAGGAVLADRRRRGPGWMETRTLRRILVQTHQETTIEGLLQRADATGIVLSGASLADQNVSLAGEVWVPRNNIRWIQDPPQSQGTSDV